MGVGRAVCRHNKEYKDPIPTSFLSMMMCCTLPYIHLDSVGFGTAIPTSLYTICILVHIRIYMYNTCTYMYACMYTAPLAESGVSKSIVLTVTVTSLILFSGLSKVKMTSSTPSLSLASNVDTLNDTRFTVEEAI